MKKDGVSKDGYRDGIWKEYHENGQLVSERGFKGAINSITNKHLSK